MAATNNGRTLSDEDKVKLAHELALGYFDHDELRTMFRIAPSSFAEYLASEHIKRMVLTKRREIDESDAAVRIHARKAARIVIDELALLVRDKDAPAKTRMQAGEQLRSFAVIADKQALSESDGPGAVIIRTNLEMGSAKGVYVISAEEIEQQEAENATLTREAVGDEIAELLGL